MLLTRISSTFRRLRDEERGAGMAAVIGLLAVSLLTTTLVATSVVQATKYTTATRAGVQSQAAAEAGIAAARSGLINGTCASSGNAYASAPGAVPEYVATLWVPSGSGWVRGCPPSTTTQVRILSTGYAAADGVSGASARDVTHLEAILSATAAPVTIVASGPAVYAYSAGSFGNGGELVSLDGTTPEVIVATGNVTCNNNFQATANLVVNGGTLTVDNGCDITGNVYASGRVNFNNSGEVGGYAVGNGVTMNNSSRVTKVWSTADFTTSGNITVSGGVKAYSMSLGGGTIGGQSYVYGTTSVTNAGATNVTGTIRTQIKSSGIPNWWSGNAKITVQNPITSPTFGSDLPASPIVPSWIDFGSQASHFTSATWVGFTVQTIGPVCTQSAVKAAIEAFGSTPGVLDGRTCSGTLEMANNTQANVYADLAIIANRIHFGNSATLTGTGGQRRLWLINPDTNANGVPTCTNSGSVVIDGNAKFLNMLTMIYSPCLVSTVSGIEITGQIFSGSTAMTNNSTLQYTAVGLPGYNLTTGGILSTTVPTESDRTIESLRNVQAGN
jgi:hypothetical protein